MHRMSVREARVAAMLTLLRDQLAPVVDELLFGELSADDRRVLATALRRVADALEPEPLVLSIPSGEMRNAQRELGRGVVARSRAARRGAGA
jgi:hypothetical protein